MAVDLVFNGHQKVSHGHEQSSTGTRLASTAGRVLDKTWLLVTVSVLNSSSVRGPTPVMREDLIATLSAADIAVQVSYRAIDSSVLCSSIIVCALFGLCASPNMTLEFSFHFRWVRSLDWRPKWLQITSAYSRRTTSTAKSCNPVISESSDLC